MSPLPGSAAKQVILKEPLAEYEKPVQKITRPAPDQTLKAGIYLHPDHRAMNSPGGLDRPGQAGADPGNYFQDLHGPVLNNCCVVPIFWGSVWTNPKAPAPSVLQVYAAMASIVSGPYVSELTQYRGIGAGHVFLANATRTPAEPPTNFKGSDLETLIGNCLDAGTVPATDAVPGQQYLYTVFLPPNVTPDPNAGGAHTYFSHGGKNVHYAWIGYGSLDGITNTFSHEFVEACTDPEGSGFTFTGEADPGAGGWIEIGDVCESYSGVLNGVNVQAYWSQKDRVCVIPTLNISQVPRWYRMGDQELAHGILNSGLALALDSNGQMHMISRGDNGDLLHIGQTASTEWGNYNSLGGYVLPDAFSVASNPDGRMEVAGIGNGGQVSHIWQTSPRGPWSGWNGLGGTGIGTPRIVRNANGSLQVLVVGNDAQIWTISQNSSADWNHAWTAVGGKVATGFLVPPIMDVIANADGRLEVFYQGADSALWHVWQTTPNGPWSAHARIGSTVSLLCLARAGSGAIVAITRGADSNLYCIEQAGSLDWGGRFTLIANTVNGSSMSAGTNEDGRVEVFFVGKNTDMQHVWQSNATVPNVWSGASSLGGSSIQKVQVAKNSDGRFELITIGGDSFAYHIWQTAPSNGWNY